MKYNNFLNIKYLENTLNKAISTNFLIIILFLLIIIFVISFISYKKVNESFGGSNSSDAFEIHSLNKWSCPDTKIWFKPKYKSYKFSELGFTTPNKVMSVSFLLCVMRSDPNWRPIFRISNKPNGDDFWWNGQNSGDGRVPGLWIWPNNPTNNPQTNNLHFRVATDSGVNDGLDTNVYIPMAVPFLITFVINNNNITCYTNNILVTSQDFNNIHPRNNNATLWIADWDAPQNYFIKNFTLYNGALSQQDVNGIYDKLEQGVDGLADSPFSIRPN